MDTVSSLNINNPAPNTVLGSQYLNPDYLFDHLSEAVRSLFHYLASPEATNTAHSIMFFLCLFFITVMMYCFVRLLEIRKKEHDHEHHEIHEYAHHQAEKEKKKQQNTDNQRNPRWAQVLQYVFSGSEGDWKLAVIEADAMLDSLLDQLGFKGDSMGDKLKAATIDRFKGLPIAWEVHTIRNRIAHEGSNFILSGPEAKRIIALYEQIFRDYGFI
jgi:hypothetical protein